MEKAEEFIQFRGFGRKGLLLVPLVEFVAVAKSLASQENFFFDERPEDSDSKNEPYCPFTLPEEEFGEMMFAKRFKPEGSSSPMLLPNNSLAIDGAGAQRQSVVDDTDGGSGSSSRIDIFVDL